MEKRENNLKDREIVVTRIFDAPRERVFEAMMDPKQVVKWWGPHGFTTTIHEMDVRPGGTWKHTMHGPDGTDYPNKSIFLEVVRPERVVYQHAGGVKERGGACFKGTWIFEDVEGKTKLTIRLTFESSKERDHTEKEYQAVEGGRQTLARLDAFINQSRIPDSEIVITRFFDIPRKKFWKIWTEPRHIEKWWGPRYFQTKVKKMDFCPEGKFEYVMIGPDGTEYPAVGHFLEIVEFEKIVASDEFGDETQSQGLTGIVTTSLFEDWNGGTKLTLHIKHRSVKDRETHEKMGVVCGWNSSFDCLDECFDDSQVFVIERSFNAPLEKVWQAITDKDKMKKWYFDLPEFRPEVGCEFRFSGCKDKKDYLHLCTVLEVIHEKKLVYSWRYDGYEGNSVVTFELFAEGEKTRLRLTHEGLETFPKSNSDLAKENFVEGWTFIIGDSLKAFIEK